MKLNCNIYMRLYHISFFMPELLSGDENMKQQDQNDENLPYYEQEEKSKFLTDAMKISDFEKKLFIVCIKLYGKLSDFLAPYVCDFTERLQDNPKKFFATIPQDKFQNTPINQMCYGMFQTLRAICYFYCKFTPCYYLFRYAALIQLGKEKIPFLKYIKSNLYAYFASRPIIDDGDCNVVLEDLADAIEKVLKNYPKTSPNAVILKDADEIIVACLAINDYIASKSKQKNLIITDNENKRRQAISKTKKKANEDRTAKIKNIIQEIKNKAQSSGLSIAGSCQKYFRHNESELKALQISSFRTLQNLCSVRDSNKQRSYFSQKVYSCPKYSPLDVETIENIVKENNFSQFCLQDLIADFL